MIHHCSIQLHQPSTLVREGEEKEWGGNKGEERRRVEEENSGGRKGDGRGMRKRGWEESKGRGKGGGKTG